MLCRKCGEEMVMQTVSETKRRSIFTILFYIILALIPIIGWVALLALFLGKGRQRGVTYAVCPRCGRRKRV